MINFHFSTGVIPFRRGLTKKHTSFFEKHKNRIASQTIAAFRCLGGAKYMKNSREFFFCFLQPFGLVTQKIPERSVWFSLRKKALFDLLVLWN